MKFRWCILTWKPDMRHLKEYLILPKTRHAFASDYDFYPLVPVTATARVIAIAALTSPGAK
jgi:hypothetical protein